MAMNLLKLTADECSELLVELLPLILNDQAIRIIRDWAEDQELKEELIEALKEEES